MEMNHLSKNRPMLIASATALGAVLLFALTVQPDLNPVRRQNPKPLRISHIPAQQELAHARKLWSPLLFSLPTKDGFSRTFLDSRNFETESTETSSAQTDHLLDTPLALPPSAAVAICVAKKPNLQIKAGKTESVFTPTTPESGVHLRVENGLTARLIKQPDLRAFAGKAKANWQHTASITVSPAEQVTHVFVEPTSGSDTPAPGALIKHPV